MAIVPFDAIARGCLDKNPPAEQGFRPNASISEVVEGVRGRRLGNVPSAVEDRIEVLVSAGLTVLELFEQATVFKRCVGWEFWPVRSFWTDHLSGSLSKHTLLDWISNARLADLGPSDSSFAWDAFEASKLAEGPETLAVNWIHSLLSTILLETDAPRIHSL